MINFTCARLSLSARLSRLAAVVSLTLVGCTSVGPDFQTPEIVALDQWSDRPSSAATLTQTLPVSEASLPYLWWEVFQDVRLNELQKRALHNSADVQTAARRFVQSRVQQRMVASRATPEVDFNAQLTRQRQSQHAPEIRLVNMVSGENSPALVELLSEPFSLYQAGFDMSWELDLWGRVRRSVEAAEAKTEVAGAQLQDVRLSVAAELAKLYFQLRQLHYQQALLDRNLLIISTLLELQTAQTVNGLSNHDPVLAQQQHLMQLQAQRHAIDVQLVGLMNQIGLLTGDEPGALSSLLAAPTWDLDQSTAMELPELRLGQPADWLRQRPDIRAAEAKLHAATAHVGVAIADLYPRIALNASAGFQSMTHDSFSQWGARTWRIGPVLSLPIFDRGRRHANIELHQQDQQIAAIAWHQRVLKAWQELDDALTAQAAERQRNQRLRERLSAAQEQLHFAQVRVRNGLAQQQAELQAELLWRQAQIELSDSDTRLLTSMVAIYKATGGGGYAPIP